jgi:hypothetical protein
LTTVAAEPMLLPVQTPAAQKEHVAAAPELRPTPRQVVEVEMKVEDLSELRMRPRRVIVVK